MMMMIPRLIGFLGKFLGQTVMKQHIGRDSCRSTAEKSDAQYSNLP